MIQRFLSSKLGRKALHWRSPTPLLYDIAVEVDWFDADDESDPKAKSLQVCERLVEFLRSEGEDVNEVALDESYWVADIDNRPYMLTFGVTYHEDKENTFIVFINACDAASWSWKKLRFVGDGAKDDDLPARLLAFFAEDPGANVIDHKETLLTPEGMTAIEV